MLLELALLTALLAHPTILLAKVGPVAVVLNLFTVVIYLFAYALASMVKLAFRLAFVIRFIAQMVRSLVASTART